MHLLRFFLLYLGFYIGITSFFFNNYICNLFFKNEDFDNANYADDNTHACSSDPDSVIFKLSKHTEKIFKWIHNNNISNTETSHLIVSST